MKRKFRRCPGCKKRNQLYHLSTAWLEGAVKYCRNCRSRLRKLNPRYCQQIKEAKKRSIGRARDFVIGYLKEHPCRACGETDICCLTFNHLGKKRANISNMIVNGCSPVTIAKEIERTEVLCASCHFRHTAHTLGYAKALVQFGS